MKTQVPIVEPHIVKVQTTNIDVGALCSLIRYVGSRILEIYNSPDFGVTLKTDNSPLTRADTLANELLCTELKLAYPHIPILSEENKEIPYEERSSWSLYWCIDPIDGTKEFISKTGDFTVNVALVSLHQPILGFVYAPYHNELYFNDLDGSYVEYERGRRFSLPQQERPQHIAIISKSHVSARTISLCQTLGITEYISRGSSLKFCLIARGDVRFYARDIPTSEWDTAASDAILRAIGCGIYILDGFEISDKKAWQRISYNKKNILNPSFIAI
jgi:3'(2'), 5'-bisphosphate nucleotidase